MGLHAACVPTLADQVQPLTDLELGGQPLDALVDLPKTASFKSIRRVRSSTVKTSLAGRNISAMRTVKLGLLISTDRPLA